jgi:methyl-accepting chemotaxis protein
LIRHFLLIIAQVKIPFHLTLIHRKPIGDRASSRLSRVSVASAVDEQGAATQEIAQNVQEAATGTADVSSNIAGVTDASSRTGQAAGEVLSCAHEVAQQTEELRKAMSGFLEKVRAA